MKKTLLLLAVVTLTTTAFAQKVWNVGGDAVNFPASGGIGAGPDLSVLYRI